MVMPVQQRCPVCRRLFMGSDCLGQPCLSCQFPGVSVLLEQQIRFWVCPDHQGGRVEWSHEASDPGGVQSIATCAECGRTSLESGVMSKFEKLERWQQLIIYHANDMLWFWHDLNEQDLAGNGWHEQRARQAFHDALLSLKAQKLIEDYDVSQIRVKVGGEWYSNRRQDRFVASGPEIDVS